MKTEKLMIHRNHKVIEAARKKIEDALPLLQQFIDEANKLQIAISTENFMQAIRDPKGFAETDLLNDLPVVEPIRHGRLVKIQEKNLAGYKTTDDITKFISLGQNIKIYLNGHLVNTALISIEKNKAVINENEMENFAVQNSYYISTPEEIETYELEKKFIDALNEYADHLNKRYGIKNITANQLNEFVDKEQKNGVERFCGNLGTFHRLTKKYRN